MMADMDMVKDRPTGARMPPLYDLECLRQHPHLERRFIVHDHEDAQAWGDRAGCQVGSIGRGDIRMGGVSTNPVGERVAKSAGLRGVRGSVSGVHKPDGSETGGSGSHVSLSLPLPSCSKPAQKSVRLLA